MIKNNDYKKIYSETLNGLIWDRKKYQVHHIDLNHDNNDFKNLVLVPTKLHKAFHTSYEKISLINENEKILSSYLGNYCSLIFTKPYFEQFLELKTEMSFCLFVRESLRTKSFPLGFDNDSNDFEIIFRRFSNNFSNICFKYLHDKE